MLSSMDLMRRPAAVRYAMTVAVVALTAGIRVIVPLSATDAPLMLFIVAVTVAAWLGGFGCGVLATLLAAIIAAYRFMEPSYSFQLVRSSQWIALFVFMFEGVAISLLLEHMHRVRQTARESDEAARDLERRLLDISEEEQRRIGHDLHDGLGQHLTGVAFLSKVLSQRLGGKNLPETAEANRIADLINQAIGWTRDLARGLSPVSVDGAGLEASITDLASQSARLFGVEVTCVPCDNLPLFDNAVAIHVYRIVQEAITNAVKHGQAKHVRIEFCRMGDATQLTMTNDGSPFTEPGDGSPGLGLRIMRYRARMIGARLEIQRLAGDRTLLLCTIPDPETPPAKPG